MDERPCPAGNEVSIGARLRTAFWPCGNILSRLGCSPVTGVTGVLRCRTLVRLWLGGGEYRLVGGAHTSSPPRTTALALFGLSPDPYPGVLRSLVREARGVVHLCIPPPPWSRP